MTIPDRERCENRGPAELRWIWCGRPLSFSRRATQPALDCYGTPARKTCVCVTVLPQPPQPTTTRPPRATNLTAGPLEESGPPASPSSSCRPSSVLLAGRRALLEVLDQTGLQQRLLAAAQPICCQPHESSWRRHWRPVYSNSAVYRQSSSSAIPADELPRPPIILLASMPATPISPSPFCVATPYN